MRHRIARGLATVLFIAGLGAAQGPTSSESKRDQDAAKPAIRPQVAGKTAKKPKPYQMGTASWYGDYFVGKPTASGEPFDMYDLTAAHPTLPLGSWVKVTNIRNGRSVVVRINDRGPVVPGRIIDVSYGVAKTLQFKERGVQDVRLDIVYPETMASLRPIAY